MNLIFPSSKAVWFKRSLPLLFLGLVVGIESGATYFFGHQTLAPLLSILSLSILAFYCSSRLLLLSTPLFIFISYLLIRGHSDYPLVRAFTVLIGVILAFWVSCSRQKLQRQQPEIETILN